MVLSIDQSKVLDLIIEGCKKKHPKSQKALYDRYAGLMLSVCCRYVADRNEAEEVMLGAFMKAFEKINQYNSDGSFEGWLRKIMVNESLMYLRKHKYMYKEVEIDQASAIAEQTPADHDLMADELMGMIHELPVGYRTVFNLYAIEGFSHKEISEKMGIS